MRLPVPPPGHEEMLPEIHRIFNGCSQESILNNLIRSCAFVENGVYWYDSHMKVSRTYLVLQKIGEMGMVTLDSFFPPNYSYTRISRKLFGLDSYPAVSPQTLSTLLSRLQGQGLVARQGKRRSSSWILTKKGKRAIQKSGEMRIPEIAEPDGITRLVIFDIPERERRKRDMLRAELIGYDFQGLQRSVWIGYRPLPQDFIEFLDFLNLKNKVHIFSVRESGTLEG